MWQGSNGVLVYAMTKVLADKILTIRLHGGLVKAKLAKYVGYEAPEISRGDRGPRERAISARYR